MFCWVKVAWRSIVLDPASRSCQPRGNLPKLEVPACGGELSVHSLCLPRHSHPQCSSQSAKVGCYGASQVVLACFLRGRYKIFSSQNSTSVPRHFYHPQRAHGDFFLLAAVMFPPYQFWPQSSVASRPTQGDQPYPVIPHQLIKKIGDATHCGSEARGRHFCSP